MTSARRPEPRLDGPAARQTTQGGFHDPSPHPLLEPAVVTPCPACGLPVGVRMGLLNRHRVRAPRGNDPGHVEPDGVRVSPLGPDGWCRAKV